MAMDVWQHADIVDFKAAKRAQYIDVMYGAMSIGHCFNALTSRNVCQGWVGDLSPTPVSARGASGTTEAKRRHEPGRRDSVATVSLRQLLEAGTHFGHRQDAGIPK